MKRGRKGPIRLIACSLIAVLVCVCPLPGQEEEPLGSNGQFAMGGLLILGTVAQEVGSTAKVPIIFSSSEEIAVRTIQFELQFPGEHIKFLGVDLGEGEEPRGDALSVEVIELVERNTEAGNSQTHLQVRAFAAGEPSATPLPKGLWGYLNFEIPAEAQEASITLEPSSLTAQGDQESPVQVMAEAGTIIVSEPIVVACFFYLH